MAASSVGTYLDVTNATRGGVKIQSDSEPGPESSAAEGAVKILAAIHSGTQLVTDLPAQTGMDLPHVLSLLGSLASSGLITIEEDGGAMRAVLTDPARDALAS